MTGQGRSHGWTWERIGPPTWEPGPANQMTFPHKRALLQTEILLNFISCPGGWSHTIPQVKKSDVEVLGGCGYAWSAVVRPVGHTAKFSKMTYVEKLTLHYLATALVDIPAVSMPIALSLRT